MGFQVKYEEITSIRELILAQLDRWIEQIDAVRSSIVEIAAMSEMHGEAAEHVRSYMWDYHMNLANMIKDTIETYRSSFILYTDWYYNIDSDQMAEMSQDSMEGLEENIQGARSDFDAVAEEVADIERELSAYLDVGRFSTTCMESCFDNALAGVQNVRTQIGEYEEAHSHADMYPIDMMVGYLRSIIGGQLGGSSATISAYDASVVNATESFQLAQMMDGMLSTYLEQVKDRVNSCEEFYELQQQQWQESIRLRTEEGIVKTIAGVGTMILGGMLVVATCGMALPLVTTVGVVAIGLGTTAYGCANAIEGSQDVYAGVTGDPRMVSVNPIRDTLFASNPDLYYLIGNTLTISASLLLTGGMAANAAVSAGTSIGRAVVTEYAKQGLTMAASSYVEKSMTEATNSPLAGFVVGSLTGMATYGTLSEAELEVVNNVKRPQQLGNVGEGGSKTIDDVTGMDWYNYYRDTYGKENVCWESCNPSEVASAWQGSYPYTGVDAYTNITLHDGDIIYMGEPFPTGYSTTSEVAQTIGNDAQKVFGGLQVKPYYEKGMAYAEYRSKLTPYKVHGELNVADGVALNNPQFGQGGLAQRFDPNFDFNCANGVLEKLDNQTISLTNTKISLEEYFGMMNEIK